MTFNDCPNSPAQPLKAGIAASKADVAASVAIHSADNLCQCHVRTVANGCGSMIPSRATKQGQIGLACRFGVIKDRSCGSTVSLDR